MLQKKQSQAIFREAFTGKTLNQRRMEAQRAAYAKAGFKATHKARVWS